MDELFKSGASSNAYPVKIIFLQVSTPLQFPAQAMFVAPKRNFKLSPDRNKLKRRMREAYRLNKSTLYESLAERRMILAFIYTGKKIESYSVIERSMIRLIGKAIAG